MSVPRAHGPVLAHLAHWGDSRHAARLSGVPRHLAPSVRSMASAATHRSRDRSTQVILRLSPEDRRLLDERAQTAGLTRQAYLEKVALGREPVIRRPGRTPQVEELPLTG